MGIVGTGPLAARRMALGLTQADMGKLLGMTPGNVSRLETGEIVGSKVSIRRAVAEHYQLSREEVDMIFDARERSEGVPTRHGVHVRRVHLQRMQCKGPRKHSTGSRQIPAVK